MKRVNERERQREREEERDGERLGVGGFDLLSFFLKKWSLEAVHDKTKWDGQSQSYLAHHCLEHQLVQLKNESMYSIHPSRFCQCSVAHDIWKQKNTAMFRREWRGIATNLCAVFKCIHSMCKLQFDANEPVASFHTAGHMLQQKDVVQQDGCGRTELRSGHWDNN